MQLNPSSMTVHVRSRRGSEAKQQNFSKRISQGFTVHG